MTDACPECGFKLWLPIAELQRSRLGLYDDARFPGRCILVFDRHEEQLHELSPSEACAFLEDAQVAARAIARATASPRINYAIFGNTEPHLHWHLIPRQPGDEPLPARPPWEHPERPAPLGADQVTRLVKSIRDAIAASG